MSLIEYRLAWARNYLKNIGAIENSSRGVWALTDVGRVFSDDEIQQRVREWKARYSREYAKRQREDLADEDEEGAETPVEIDTENWKDNLIAALLDLTPEAFERLCQRLLREAGFRNVEVLGRTGDGGLDGVGVYRLSLVSFPIYFQSKRYKGTVRAGAVRDFRGAMSGRGEKGLLITTGTFTREGHQEASREGAPPVELIDGENLCDLLKSYGLGVKTQEKTVEHVSLDHEFFEQL